MADISSVMGLEVARQGFSWITPVTIAHLCTFVPVEMRFLPHNLAQTSALRSCVLKEFEQPSLRKHIEIATGLEGKNGVPPQKKRERIKIVCLRNLT